jgi:hypothetical protein
MLLEVIERAYWILISQALLATLVVVFISLPVAVLILSGYVQIRRRRIGLPRHFLVFLFAALLFPVGEALIGAAAYDTQSDLAGYASLSFFVLSFLFTVVATVKEKGRRLFVFGVACTFTVWAFWAMCVAQMSIANSWL